MRKDRPADRRDYVWNGVGRPRRGYTWWYERHAAPASLAATTRRWPHLGCPGGLAESIRRHSPPPGGLPARPLPRRADAAASVAVLADLGNADLADARDPPDEHHRPRPGVRHLHGRLP